MTVHVIELWTDTDRSPNPCPDSGCDGDLNDPTFCAVCHEPDVILKLDVDPDDGLKVIWFQCSECGEDYEYFKEVK